MGQTFRIALTALFSIISFALFAISIPMLYATKNSISQLIIVALFLIIPAIAMARIAFRNYKSIIEKPLSGDYQTPKSGIITCSACKAEISAKASSCPKCGHPNVKAKDLSAIQIILAISFIGILSWYFFGGGLESNAKTRMHEIENQVAMDAVSQYKIALAQGDKIQICVQAGYTAAAFLQAKDEKNYNIWKDIESAACRVAEMQYK